MKKIVLTLSAIVLASTYFFGQCTVEISTPNLKICSNQSAILTSKPFSLTSVPNILDSSEIINLSTVKDITPDMVKIINSMGGSGISLPIPNFSKETEVNLPGIKLINTNVTSGSINIKFSTNLNQDLTIVFELPYFKIDGKPLVGTLSIKGNSNAKAGTIFTDEIKLDLTNAKIDFTAGKPSNYNIVSYKVTPTLSLSTKSFTGKETGNLKVEINDLKFAENITYSWFTEKTKLNDDTPNITVKDAGKYIVETTSICGTARDTIEIFVVEKPSNKLTVNGPLTFCEGKTKTILKAASNPKYIYKWSNASIDSNVTITKSGDYSVTITNDICSTPSEVIKIKVNPNPVIKLSKKDTTIYKGDIVILKVSGASSYVWNTKSKYDTISIKDAGTYTVVGTNEFGCTSSDSMKLTVKVKTTGITDLASDKFQVYPNPASNNVYISLANFTNTSLRMYDLIGNEVFHQVIKNEVTEVPVNQFAKGMYLVKIENANSNTIESKRFVVE
jgi:hypothetical protein